MSSQEKTELTKLDQIRAAEARLLIPTYDRNPILFVTGEGVHIVDENGARYLDLLSGIGVNALGYNHPVVVEAIARQSRALATSTGALLIVDEIQAGMGRTGKWCAYQHYGILPDITTLAKPLAGGLPLGATLCTEEVARAFHPGMHGSTFAGGPLACAVAIAVIDHIESKNLLAHATEVGDYFQSQLRSLASRHSAIIDVRGRGLMLAAELDSADLAKLTVAEMLKRHILINCTSDTVLRFLPPYILERTHVDTAIAALDEIFTEHAAAAHSAATAQGGHIHG